MSFNEIFIEIDEIFIENNKDNLYKKMENENNIISLNENEDQANFLGDKHHLFKRFCRRGNNIYVFNFIGFETVKLRKKQKNKKKDEEKEYDNSFAVFICEQNNCYAKYRYNFNSNRLTEIKPHRDCAHIIDKNAPSYYKQNIDILNEKVHITDIQLVRTGKNAL